MTLLTLMQRAGVIQVRTVPTTADEPGSIWDIEILQPGIFSDSHSPAWNTVFETRDREQSEAKSALDPFISVMLNPQRACVTRSVFELIEPQAFAPPCGRCPACRAHHREPPDVLASSGLESAWTKAPHWTSPLPSGLLLVDPVDPTFKRGLEALLARLSNLGVEQFIVPDDIIDETPRLLANGVGLGLVVNATNMRPQIQIAGLPTALLLPHDTALAGFLISRFKDLSLARPNLSMIIVAEPDRHISGRRLDQTVSAYAPINENGLDSLK